MQKHWNNRYLHNSHIFVSVRQCFLYVFWWYFIHDVSVVLLHLPHWRVVWRLPCFSTLDLPKGFYIWVITPTLTVVVIVPPRCAWLIIWLPTSTALTPLPNALHPWCNCSGIHAADAFCSDTTSRVGVKHKLRSRTCCNRGRAVRRLLFCFVFFHGCKGSVRKPFASLDVNLRKKRRVFCSSCYLL